MCYLGRQGYLGYTVHEAAIMGKGQKAPLLAYSTYLYITTLHEGKIHFYFHSFSGMQLPLRSSF